MTKHTSISHAQATQAAPIAALGHGLLAALLAAFIAVPAPAWAASLADDAEAGGAGTAISIEMAPSADDATGAAPGGPTTATPSGSSAEAAAHAEAESASAIPQRTALVSLASTEADPSMFAGGTGTAADPYQIASTAQLGAFRDAVNQGATFAGETVKLTGFAYDLGEGQWTPIGTGTRSGSGFTGASFQGVFDGGGATITGLTLTGTFGADEPLGLFGIVAGGTVENLVLQDATVDAAGNECAGAAAGLLTDGGLIANVTVNGQVSATNGCGGIAGRLTLNGAIEHCTNNASVTATAGANVGGIVGAAYYTALDQQMRIAHCTNTAAISGKGVAGGIVGLSAANVQDCTNSETATVTSSSFSVGGIVGEQQNFGQISGCVNHGAVTNTSGTGYGTGGIVGWVRYSGQPANYARSGEVTLTQNINTAAVKGGTGTAGIAGCVFNAATVTHNTNMAPSLAATTFVAGVVGDFQTYTTPIGTVPKDELIVTDNVSTTPLDAMTGADKAQYAYTNGNEATLRDNTDVLPSEPTKDPVVPDGGGAGTSDPSGGGGTGDSTGSTGTDGTGSATSGGGRATGSAGVYAVTPQASDAAGAEGSGSGDAEAATGIADDESLALADEFAEGRNAAEEHDDALADESAAVNGEAVPGFPFWGLVLLGLLLAAAIAALVVVVRKYRASATR